MKLTTKDLCLTALFTAIVFVMTFVPKIPIPLGYAHLGDAAVLLAVVLLGRKQGAIAGAVGSALADLIGGFALWIVPTLLIKYIMAWIFGILYKSNHNSFVINGGNLTAIFLGLVWMVAAGRCLSARQCGSRPHGGGKDREHGGAGRGLSPRFPGSSEGSGRGAAAHFRLFPAVPAFLPEASEAALSAHPHRHSHKILSFIN